MFRKYSKLEEISYKKLFIIESIQVLEIENLNINGLLEKEIKWIPILKGLRKLNLSRNSLVDSENNKAISSLTNLTSLNVSKNLFTDKTAEYIGKLNDLTELDISENCIGADGAICLSNLTKLTFLDIGGNRIGSAGAEVIKNFTHLTSLCVSYCYLNDVEFLSPLKHLKHLNISENSNLGTPENLELIAGMKELTSLNATSCGINEIGANLISSMENLTTLVIFNSFFSSGAKPISTMRKLTELDISWCGIQSEGAKNIISGLSNLTKLDISNNEIKAEGLQDISNLEKLTQLNVSMNNIGLEGALSISKLKNLTSLQVRRKDIGRDGKTILKQFISNK